MKIKVFLALLAFASSVFAQITCPNDTTVGKFVNPYKNQLNLENLESLCETEPSDLDPNGNFSSAALGISSPEDGDTVTVGSCVFEFEETGGVLGDNLSVDIGSDDAETAANFNSGFDCDGFISYLDQDTASEILIFNSVPGLAGNSVVTDFDGGSEISSFAGGLDGVAGNAGQFYFYADEETYKIFSLSEDATSNDNGWAAIPTIFSDAEETSYSIGYGEFNFLNFNGSSIYPMADWSLTIGAGNSEINLGSDKEVEIGGPSVSYTLSQDQTAEFSHDFNFESGEDDPGFSAGNGSTELIVEYDSIKLKLDSRIFEVTENGAILQPFESAPTCGSSNPGAMIYSEPDDEICYCKASTDVWTLVSDGTTSCFP